MLEVLREHCLRDELSHSRLPAALFDPRHHRGAATMLGVLLQGIVGVAGLKGRLAERFQMIAEAPWGWVAVSREHFLLMLWSKLTPRKVQRS